MGSAWAMYSARVEVAWATGTVTNRIDSTMAATPPVDLILLPSLGCPARIRWLSADVWHAVRIVLSLGGVGNTPFEAFGSYAGAMNAPGPGTSCGKTRAHSRVHLVEKLMGEGAVLNVPNLEDQGTGLTAW